MPSIPPHMQMRATNFHCFFNGCIQPLKTKIIQFIEKNIHFHNLSGVRIQMILQVHQFLVGGLEHEFHFSIQLGMSSSQPLLTPSFFGGVGRKTTNQIIINHH